VLSILIPNFNNGKQSSRSGIRDFIGDLFRSLEETLEGDPTPLEVLVDDDGSSDDSLETCRAWSRRTWRGGERFLSLNEYPHVGVLSTVANRLTRRSQGEFLVRLDGDTVLLTKHWARRLVEIFRAAPADVGVVGARQLAVDGSIHSMGSWILHPRSHHHVGQGFPATSVLNTIEVDHVMGCFYAHRRAVWDELGGYDERILRGQTVDFGLRARLHGWRAIAVPTIDFIHAHSERKRRENRADTPQGIAQSLDTFVEKWGFDRLAPDLETVRRHYAGTSLLWNHRVFGPRLDWPFVQRAATDVPGREWTRYESDPAFRAQIDLRVRLAEEARATAVSGPMVILRARTGLLAHLLAQRGAEVIGVERDEELRSWAEKSCAGRAYPGPAPRFVRADEGRELDGAIDRASVFVLFDLLEHHWNPIGVLRELQRHAVAGSRAAVLVRRRLTPFDADADELHAYRPHELRGQAAYSCAMIPIDHSTQIEEACRRSALVPLIGEPCPVYPTGGASATVEEKRRADSSNESDRMTISTAARNEADAGGPW